MYGGGQPGGALGKYSGEVEGVPAGSSLERMLQGIGWIGSGVRPSSSPGYSAPVWTPQPQPPIIAGNTGFTQPPPGLNPGQQDFRGMSPFDTAGGVQPMQDMFSRLFQQVGAQRHPNTILQNQAAGLPGTSPANALANWQPRSPAPYMPPSPQQPAAAAPAPSQPVPQVQPEQTASQVWADDYSRQLEAQRSGGGGE